MKLEATHSNGVQTFTTEEGSGSLSLGTKELESGALRTTLEVYGRLELTDRDCAVLSAQLLARSHAPEAGAS